MVTHDINGTGALSRGARSGVRAQAGRATPRAILRFWKVVGDVVRGLEAGDSPKDARARVRRAKLDHCISVAEDREQLVQAITDRLNQGANTWTRGGAAAWTESGLFVSHLWHEAGHPQFRADDTAHRRPRRNVKRYASDRQATATVNRMTKTVQKRKPIRTKQDEGGDAPLSPAQLIDARIKELGDWRGKTLARVRKLIKQADPRVVEEWKWGVPVWSRGGIICTGETYKNAVKLTFAKGASLDDPSGLFNSSLEGKTRRAIDLHEGDRIDEKALKALVRAAATLNARS
ncbi:MAG TPA: DUF1801 domain-containing protein [Phycisphaerales bacterium]|nr:DUF1801 domain-containing protein [Phycisphaerales bacterium]